MSDGMYAAYTENATQLLGTVSSQVGVANDMARILIGSAQVWAILALAEAIRDAGPVSTPLIR